MNHNPINEVTVIQNATASGSTVMMANSLANLADPLQGERELFAVVEQAYHWFDSKNKQQAQQHLRAVALAKQQHLDIQVRHHAYATYKWVTKDAADGTAQLVQRRLNHAPQYYYHPENLAIPQNRFTVPIANGYPPTQWVYQPIQSFAQVIPLHALEAMNLLAEAHMQPPAYWVADKVTVQRIQRLSLDPLLCAQYGRWFVSIAQWL